MKNRFYIKTRGNDDQAYNEAIEFACKLAEKDKDIKRVILLALDRPNVGWIERLYGSDVVEKMFEGTTINNCDTKYKIETIKTYRDNYIPSEIVITLGLYEKDIFPIDNFNSIKTIIVIPWTPETVQEWIKEWNPIELRNNNLLNLI